jgi:hypothetical protein
VKNISALVLFLVFFGISYSSADQSNVFISPTAGFKITKPADWHYTTVAENLENIKAMKLNDKKFHEAMQKYATAPLVAMTKFPEPYDDINPSFKVNIKPYGQLKEKSPTELINLVIPQFQKMLNDFELVQPPIEVDVSGIKSAYARMNYIMQIPDGNSFLITSEIWIVPRSDYFFMLGAGTRQDEKTGSRKEIAAILDTVKIEQ